MPVMWCLANPEIGVQAGRRAAGLDAVIRRCRDQAMSNRSRFMTLSHAATKSWTNFSRESSLA